MSRTFKDKGYTLVELIVYVGIVVLLMAAIAQASVTAMAANRRAKSFADAHSTVVAAFGSMSRDVRRAVGVDIEPGRINLQFADGGMAAYYIENGAVVHDDNGVIRGGLSADGATVKEISFRRVDSASTTAVRIEMTVSPALIFYGTYALRQSHVE